MSPELLDEVLNAGLRITSARELPKPLPPMPPVAPPMPGADSGPPLSGPSPSGPSPSGLSVAGLPSVSDIDLGDDADTVSGLDASSLAPESFSPPSESISSSSSGSAGGAG